MPDLALTRVPRRSRSAPPRAPRASWRERRAASQDDLVVMLVTQHADSVLRITRRLSLCDADAEDAYQRALEILLRNAGRLDPARAPSWLRTVAKHEALAIRSQRSDGVERDSHDPDEHIATDLTSTEEQVARVDRFTRAAEALRDLKPDEARALWLRAEGYSYDEIASTNAWSYTKVNRLLSEGRARFLSRYATIESGGACAEWQPVLSAIVDGEAKPEARREAGVHLRSCLGCRATLRHLRSSAPSVRMALPAAGLISVAGGAGRRPDPGSLVRFVEGAWAGLHERAASAAVGAQTVVDGFSAGKVAAVTASVAALAGGGVVVAEDRADVVRGPREASAAGQTVSTPGSAPPVAVVGGGGPALVTTSSTTPSGASSGGASSGAARTTTTPVASAAKSASKPEFTPPVEAAEPASSPSEFSPPREFREPASSSSSASSSDAEPAASVAGEGSGGGSGGSSRPSGSSGSSGGEFSSPRQQDRGEFAP